MRKELCRPCAEQLKAKGKKLKVLEKGVDKKVFCAECHRRRFGAAYDV